MNNTKSTLWVRILLAFAMVSTLALTGAQTVRAMEIDNDGKVGADEVINDDLILTQDTVDMAGTVNGNLIAFGSTITISGTVNGDVIAGGSIVNITGTVNGNVLAMGGEILADGKVEGSLFFGGNSLTVGPNARVGSNMYAAGFSISLQPGSVVTRDIAAAGYQVILAGEIGRDVRADVGAFELTGKVGRNIILTVGEPAGDQGEMAYTNFMPFSRVSRLIPVGIHIQPGATIGGTLDYYSPVEQTAGIQANPEGGVVYHYKPSENADNLNKLKTAKQDLSTRIFDFGGMFMGYVFGVIREFLTLVLLGALAVWLIPSLLTRTAGTLRAKPLPSLGWGFVVLVLGIVGLIMAFFLIIMLGLAIGVVTLFGLMGVIFSIGFSATGLVMALFLALAQYGSKLVVALLIGDWFLRLFRKDYSASSFWPLLLGILMMVLVDALPILGTLVGFCVALFGLGAIWLVFRDWWKTRTVKA
ncbi:MAG: polymer-forming cytoskeletal protein [Anaerolineales bacterium]